MCTTVGNCVGVNIRRITALDGLLLRRVRLEALKDAPSAFSSTFDLEAGRTDAEWVERAVAGSRGRDRATFFGMVDDQVVGLVGGFRPEAASPAVEMVSMWVAPDARRRGVGAALIDSVRAWAVETEATSIWAGVMVGNDAAQRLYLSKGFAERGSIRRLASDASRSEVRMQLALTE
jgi:ribosomal protein S18 acetylase RimI-like enzyme